MQFFAENSLVVYTFTAIVIPALLLAILYLFEIFRTENRAKKTAMYGFFAFIFMFVGYLCWLIRANILPAAALISEYLVYFQLAYTFIAIGGSFMTVWLLSLMYPGFLESRKWLVTILLFIVGIAIIAITWFGPMLGSTAEMAIQGTNDVHPGGYMQMTYLLMIINLILMFFAIIQGYRADKDSKILLLFVAILIYLIGLFMEGMKLMSTGADATIWRGLLAFGLWLTFIWALLSKRV